MSVKCGYRVIDCYAKFLDEEKILVKELPGWNPEYGCVEELAEYLVFKIKSLLRRRYSFYNNPNCFSLAHLGSIT